jgi:hypothetical protein
MRFSAGTGPADGAGSGAGGVCGALCGPLACAAFFLLAAMALLLFRDFPARLFRVIAGMFSAVWTTITPGWRSRQAITVFVSVT